MLRSREHFLQSLVILSCIRIIEMMSSEMLFHCSHVIPEVRRALGETNTLGKKWEVGGGGGGIHKLPTYLSSRTS